MEKKTHRCCQGSPIETYCPCLCHKYEGTMNHHDAIDKARELWGHLGEARAVIVNTGRPTDGLYSHQVGYKRQLEFRVMGAGRTWEEAFENAVKLQKEKRHAANASQ